MSEASEKPFEATPRRIAKAKREGNVARSSEFAASLSFAAAAATAAAAAPMFGAVARRCLAAAATSGHAAPHVALVLAVALLVVGGAGLAGASAGLVQTGGVTFAGAAPKLERLNPVEGVRRMCSRETLAHSLRSGLAFLCALVTMVPLIGTCGAALLGAGSWRGAAAGAWKGAESVAAAAAAIGLGFSIAEYGTARSAWLRRLRMSFEERKRESKDEEGDAVVRGRRRALHRSLLRGGLRRVRDAAFVVVNPEHVAVALEYRPPAVPVPKVLVRAINELALQVRFAARRYGVPIVENTGLAHALYRDGRSGQPIPHAHYVAVAEVVAALLRAEELRS
ncbi:MAG: EscU/YscU/HrcU family type III secretion system export apparatus switch protein [Candidatus Eremiobacteraeota bacterium]|nr:EscU/YscU/HrcU family type III secretion system export apparatus switch protein [Candidatus Eremiobacteraeota bacterium]MBV8499105.1 EscU/YscU/HrcU family type III secretion system export apparatus switch protein [Candidatus Eremiobacteraeota bacterium]